MKRALGITYLALLASFAIVATARAVTFAGPATGLWANPADGGRGWNIDIQGDTMTVTTFVYQSNGAPIWYLSSGRYNHDTGVFTSSYDSFSNGQCFGCTPRQPDVHSGAAGNMRIDFRDNEHATITTPAGRQAIEKFNYGFSSRTAMLYGMWAFSMNSGAAYTVDWINFTGPYSSGGKTYAQGETLDGRQRVVLGQYVDWEIGTLVLADAGSYYHAYQMMVEATRGVGLGWVYPKTGSLSGNGWLASAGRLVYPQELSGVTQPMAKGDRLDTSAQDATVAAQSGPELLAPELDAAFRGMIEAIEGMAR